MHYSKAKCPMAPASPLPAELSSHPSPAPAVGAERQIAAALKHAGHIADNHVEQFKANIRAVSDAKAAAISKPHAIAPQQDRLVGDLLSEKLEREKRDKALARVLLEKRQAEENFERERREKAAMIAEKAERERRDREVARILAEKREIEGRMERERRERELARQKEFHQNRIDKQAEAAIAAACHIDRAQEDRAKQKRQQILALEDFRQRQAKQWLGDAVQCAPPNAVPADPCSVRKEAAVIQDADIAAAKRLWSAKSPALNSADEVKARGAAQKIEEQQRYEQALAIARKQAFMERLAAEDRRQRELHSALEAAQPNIMKTPLKTTCKAAAAHVPDPSLPSAGHEQVPAAAPWTPTKAQLDDGSTVHAMCAVAAAAPPDANSNAVCDDRETLELCLQNSSSKLSDPALYVCLIAFIACGNLTCH